LWLLSPYKWIHQQGLTKFLHHELEQLLSV
jgi:hypothetical protein